MKHRTLIGVFAAVIILTMAIAYSAFALTSGIDKSKQQNVEALELDGIITQIKENTVSIKGEDGLTKTITFNGKTIFEVEKMVQATPKDLKIGDEIEATGISVGENKINAGYVKIEAKDADEKNKKD